MLIGAALLYIALAAGFYIAIIATAQEMPAEAVEPTPRDKRERRLVSNEDEAEQDREHTLRMAS